MTRWATTRRGVVWFSTLVFLALGLAFLSFLFSGQPKPGIFDALFIVGTPTVVGWLGGHLFWVSYLRQVVEQNARDRQVPRS